MLLWALAAACEQVPEHRQRAFILAVSTSVATQREDLIGWHVSNSLVRFLEDLGPSEMAGIVALDEGQLKVVTPSAMPPRLLHYGLVLHIHHRAARSQPFTVLRAGLGMIERTDDEHQWQVVLVYEGEPPGLESILRQEGFDVLMLHWELRHRGIRLHAVQLGPTSAPGSAGLLALLSGGTYLHVPEVGELPRMMCELRQDLVQRRGARACSLRRPGPEPLGSPEDEAVLDEWGRVRGHPRLFAPGEGPPPHPGGP